jgi:pilus assembly protein TadC
MVDHAANERYERETEDALRRAEELLDDGNSVHDTMEILDAEFLGGEIWPSASATMWREVEILARKASVR